MALSRLSVRDFRCFEILSVDLALGNNLIVGPNASGKTSFLEAVYFLGRGRSFRVAQSQRLIRQDAPHFTISGQTSSGDTARDIQLGVKFKPKNVVVKVDGERCSGFAALAENLPVQVIHPDVHQLVEGGPGFRRRFLDWGVFHVKPNFLSDWREFSRALKQRNAGLRQRLPRTQVDTWTDRLSLAGTRVDAARIEYCRQLAPFVTTTSQRLLGQGLKIQYRSGWRQGLTYREALAASWVGDFERKTTQVGPQRAELGLFLDDLAVQGRVSRGQQKLLAATLILAQIQLLESLRPRNTVLLLDDPAAELDNQSLDRFLEIVGQLETQLLITALRTSDLPEAWRSTTVFHVEQGKLMDVVQ